MQSKINSFFKPSSSSSSIKSDQCLPLSLEDDDHELALWENAEHQFVNTYKRRAPKSHDGDKSVEANRRPVSDVLTIPILKDPCMKPESTSSGKVLNKKSYAQLHLDLGQSDFNLRTCSTCGVKYAPGEEGDEKNHKTFHRNYTFGVQYKCCRKERVVHMPCSHGGSIVLVLNDDPPAQRKKVQEIVKLMEIELGGGWIFHKLCKARSFLRIVKF